jgi:DNA-binding NarL/FixJ family response regulator
MDAADSLGMSPGVELPNPLVEVVLDGSPLRARLEQALRGQDLELRDADSSPREPAQALESAIRQRVIVTAGRLSDLPGHSLVGSLRERTSPEAKIVVCTERAGRRELRQAIEQGLDGLVWERSIETSLAPTVRAVAAGQLVIPRELHRRLETPNLSVREKQVLSLVVMGLSNNEIAQRLFIGQTTVKTHLSSVFRKLGVSSRAEAAHLVADPDEGLGTGILRITEPGARGADGAARSVAGGAAGTAPGEQAGGEMAEEPADAPEIGAGES